MKKTCAECGMAFSGRADKKFCSDYCRATSHNRTRKVILPHIKETNKILVTNRKILEKLNPIGKAKIHKETLLNLGFRFNYCTNIQMIRKNQYYFCYDYGYRVYHNGYCLIIRKDNKVLQ